MCKLKEVYFIDAIAGCVIGSLLDSEVGTTHLKKIVDDFVSEMSFFIIRQPIIHLLALPSVFDKAVLFEVPQVMGDGGIRHLNRGSDIAYALLDMAEQPKNSQASTVRELLKCPRCFDKVMHIRHHL
jgi:hypothetical protein